jgi:hypothetical protein
MSELIPSALDRKQPAVFLSGPSFAREVMENRPTGIVAACKDTKLANTVRGLWGREEGVEGCLCVMSGCMAACMGPMCMGCIDWVAPVLPAE